MEEKLYFKFNQTLTKDDYTAFAKKLPSLKTIRIFYGVMIALCIVSGILSIVSHSSKMGFNLSMLITLAVVLLVFIIIFPYVLGKQTYQNAIKLGSLTDEIALCENEIYDTDENGFKRFRYSQIEKVVETDTHYFLFLSKTAAMILKKDSLTYGESDFVSFINSKIG